MWIAGRAGSGGFVVFVRRRIKSGEEDKTMCCCGKPTINGELGYRWNNPNGPAGVHPINAPLVKDDETILYDEPGRCGGTDSHSHHYRIIKPRFGPSTLLVRHGGGDERYSLGYGDTMVKSLESMDSTARYWMLDALYHVVREAMTEARDKEAAKWRTAAANGRLKTRKQRGRDSVKVWIEAA
jgi:hypothetical protein